MSDDALHAYIRNIRQGTPFTAKHLLHLAPRREVDSMLGRLVRWGLLRRVGHGVYYVRYVSFDTVPDAVTVAGLHLMGLGELVQVHGGDAAASFGLDAPPRDMPRLYTSARTRTYFVDNDPVRLCRVPGVYLSFAGTRAGVALAVLHYLGAAPDPSDVARIHAGISEEDRRRVRSVLAHLPHRVVRAWLQADPAIVVSLPERVSPTGPKRRQTPHWELVRRWREENLELARKREACGGRELRAAGP